MTAVPPWLGVVMLPTFIAKVSFSVSVSLARTAIVEVVASSFTVCVSATATGASFTAFTVMVNF